MGICMSLRKKYNFLPNGHIRSQMAFLPVYLPVYARYIALDARYFRITHGVFSVFSHTSRHKPGNVPTRHAASNPILYTSATCKCLEGTFPCSTRIATGIPDTFLDSAARPVHGPQKSFFAPGKKSLDKRVSIGYAMNVRNIAE